MTLVTEIRHTVTDVTPVYAAVGATDLVVEKVRDASVRAASIRVDVTELPAKAVKPIKKVAGQAQHIPAQVRTQTVEVAGKAKQTYADLAVRGEKLVNRLRNQKATKNLFAQAGNTVSLGKGAVTTVRNAALDTQRAAMSTLATGRREAGSVASSVQEDVKATGRTVTKAAASTLTSAKATVTSAKKGTASAERATKSVAANARKTASSATTAAKTATPKIGD